MSSNQQARYGHNAPPQHTRNHSSSSQPQPSTNTFNYESYQASAVHSHPQSVGASPATTPQVKQQEYSGDGDVAMEDADPYNRMKYPSRPSHSHRTASQYLSQEDSTAARRYSPMKALSSSSPYTVSPQQPNHSSYNAYAPQNAAARQSPTRSNAYQTPTSQPFYPSPGMFLFVLSKRYNQLTANP